MDLLEGKTILKKNGADLSEVAVNDAFKDVKMTAYYFGAKWCDDCVKFSPLLRDIYNEAKENNESFEVIYVSSDKTEDEMREFVSEFHPDWYVFYVDEEDDTTDDFQLIWGLRGFLDINGIPNLVVMKEDHTFATMDGITDLIQKGPQAIAYWKENVVDRDEFVEPISRTEENEGKIIPNCCSITKFKPWVNKPPVEIFNGKKLMRKVDNEFKTEDVENALSDKEIVAVYFSAHWCPPCRHFTPILKKYYEELSESKKSFEVVFVSFDETEKELESYMLESHGDWLVLKPPEDKSKRQLNNMFSVDGIPSLAIVNQKGELLTLDGSSDIEIIGAEIFDRWVKGLPGATKDEKMAYWERMQKERTEEEQNANEDEN